jgi:hypothetical protein
LDLLLLVVILLVGGGHTPLLDALAVMIGLQNSGNKTILQIFLILASVVLIDDLENVCHPIADIVQAAAN